jgi:hypothetical protein
LSLIAAEEGGRRGEESGGFDFEAKHSSSEVNRSMGDAPYTAGVTGDGFWRERGRERSF